MSDTDTYPDHTDDGVADTHTDDDIDYTVLSLDTLNDSLRTERRLAWLPPAVIAVSGGVDMIAHGMLETAVQANHPAGVAIALAVGAGTGATSTLIAAWLASARDALTDLPPLRRVFGMFTAANTVLALFGDQPVILGAYLLLGGLGTAKWMRTRRTVRRQLREAITVVDVEPRMIESTAPLAIEPAPEPTPVDVEPPIYKQARDIVARWASDVASNVLQGTFLTDPHVFPDGRIQYVVDSHGKGVLVEAANTAKARIASILRLELPDREFGGGQEIVFDQPWDMGLDAGQIRMQVVTRRRRDAIVGGQGRFTGDLTLDPTNPYRVRIGGYIDTGEPLYLTFATAQDGTLSLVVYAGTRMGKSSLFDLIAYVARRLGFDVVYVDPAGGTSSPVLTRYAKRVLLGPNQQQRLYNYLKSEVDSRQDWCTMHGVGKIVPGLPAPCTQLGDAYDPDCPCGGAAPTPLLIEVDECHLFFNENIGRTIEKWGVPFGELTSCMAKLAMAMVTASHLTDLNVFGGSDMLRSSLATHQQIALYIASIHNANQIPGLPYSPNLLPRKKGRALAGGEAMREMEADLDWIVRRDDAALVDGIGPFAEDLFDELPPYTHSESEERSAQLLPGATDGDLDAIANARHAARARYAALLTGERVAIEARADDDTPAPRLPLGSLDFTVPDAVTGVHLDPPTAEQLEAIDAVLAVIEAGEPTAEQRTAIDVIWDLLSNGVRAKSELIRASGYGETHVRNTLDRLIAGLPDGRRAVRGRRGEYEPISLVEA